MSNPKPARPAAPASEAAAAEVSNETVVETNIEVPTRAGTIIETNDTVASQVWAPAESKDTEVNGTVITTFTGVQTGVSFADPAVNQPAPEAD